MRGVALLVEIHNNHLRLARVPLEVEREAGVAGVRVVLWGACKNLLFLRLESVVFCVS
jgi:hypothetical protein